MTAANGARHVGLAVLCGDLLLGNLLFGNLLFGNLLFGKVLFGNLLGFAMVSAGLCRFRFFVWFCAGLCWSLPVSLFCAGFVLVALLVSAGFAVLFWFCAGLCWSLLVSAGFAVLCWFCAGICWSLPVSLFCGRRFLQRGPRLSTACLLLSAPLDKSLEDIMAAVRGGSRSL